jgi:2',3'-cyclic-nucleotide 2'-phosphodiesterase (5'-nucleotidase family)
VKLALRLLFVFLAACAQATVPSDSRQAGIARGSFDLVVVSTTDVHGRIRGWDYYGDSAESVRGLTRAATIVDSVRAANPGRVVLVDAGDLLQGNPFAHVAMKQFGSSVNPIIAAMNAMHYDAAAIGNHEYNYGVPYLERAVSQARFPMLSANTWMPGGSHKFKPWTMVERQGVKIGIVGATTPGVMVWDATNVRGRVRLAEIVPAVSTAVRDVRAAGASIVIVALHSGLDEPSSYDTVATGLASENVARQVALRVPGIDLLVYGHSHKEQQDLHIGPTLLMQPKNWATSVGVAHLNLFREGGAWKVRSSRGETIPSAGRLEQRALLALSAPAHRATVAYANETIGTTPVAWRADSARLKDTPLIDFINEVEMKAANSDLALSPAYSLDASLAAGPVTVAGIAQLYPYDNTLRAVRISGKDLRDYLEFSSRYYRSVENGRPVVDPEVRGYNFDIISGADYSIDLSRPIGSRVTKLVFNGKPVAPADSLTLALHDYRQSGGGGYTMLRGAPVVYDQQQEIRQLLIDEVRARKILRPEDYFKPNWSLTFGAGSQAVGAAELPAGALRLRIIATNDFHGALEPRADANGVLRGGAAYVAAAIETAKSECAPSCETLVLDGGDQFQGTPISNLAYGRPVVEFYNRMGLTAAALGNHEFDWGVDTLRARMRDASYAILGANVKLTDGTDVSWIRDDTIVVRGNTRIGIIGISTPTTPTETLAANVRGLRFLDPAPVIDQHARSLRARGADVVIVVAHEGGFCNTAGGTESCTGDIFRDASKITEKIDLIVSGHTHSQVNTTVRNIPIVQARSSGQAIEVVDIELGADGKPAGEAFAQVRSVTAASAVPYAPVDSIVRRAAARVATIVNRRVATIRVPLMRDGDQYPLGNLVADGQRWAGKGDLAVMNNHGIRADLPAGEITYGKLFVIQPFANTLYRIRMTGAEVREYFEKLLGGDDIGVHVSGVIIGYNPDKPRGERIVSLRLPAGRTLSDNAFYDVVMNNFMATGGSNMGPPEGSRATPLNIIDLDALIDYLRALKAPITPPAESRFFIVQ